MTDEIQSSAQTQHSAALTHLRFSGRAGEYFGIWIVNVFLSLVTLGIYSAWAKVRNRRYFYGHTTLRDNAFDYVANPVAILKGRLIGFALLVVYLVANQFFPIVAFVVLLALWAMLPWLIVRSRVFNARNTTFRSIRFNYTGALSESAKIYIVFGILTVLTLGLLYPYLAYLQKRFYVDKHRFGKMSFAFDGKVGYFYGLYIGVAAIILASLIFWFMVFGGTLGMFASLFGGQAGSTDIAVPDSDIVIPASVIWVMVVQFAFLGLLGLAVMVFIRTYITNYVLGCTSLGQNGLESTLQFWRLFYLYVTNTLAIVLTVGLAIPWARIRVWRYRVENIHLRIVDDLESFVAESLEKASATGEEIGEAFDFDTGF